MLLTTVVLNTVAKRNTVLPNFISCMRLETSYMCIMYVRTCICGQQKQILIHVCTFRYERTYLYFYHLRRSPFMKEYKM